jgi:hypothetical protein
MVRAITALNSNIVKHHKRSHKVKRQAGKMQMARIDESMMMI